ncbi:MAG: NAD-dependent epimerase/dehydratase family protein [Methanothrix sp.]|jgi:UDP-glucose 4-epimerase|uniref:NAD-dependent epimerase/dehydratase family protein n=1 Tax=Methanothrix sp. TaxID=90426 RepID=UPI001BD4F168|nr:GDP-mannose 4,6-dehydratase [Methanothrix sp.]
MGLSEKTILITGEEGFAGRHLLHALKRLNSSMVSLKDQNGKRVDIRDKDLIRGRRRELEDIDIVYHLAARTAVNSSYESPHATYETNVLGTLNMLELCRLCDIDKIVYASSYVYGTPQYLPIDEKHITSPNNPYSKSKLLGEELCRSYHEDFGIKCIIFRPFNIYGPGQRADFLIPKIISSLSSGEVVVRDPEPKRDFVHITDMVDAYIKGGEYQGDFDIFNIGYGKSYSVKEIIEKIISIYGSNIKVAYEGERRKNEIMDCYADTAKARATLDWRPLISIDEGLQMMVGNP